MSLFIIAACIIFLIILISWGRINPFLAFLLVSLLAGWWLGIPIEQLTRSVKKGIGDMLGELVIIICTGAMLGKLVAESGAAQQISQSLMKVFGRRYFHWAMMATGFVVGIPLFYSVGFVLMVPLVFSVVYQTKLPALFVGIPMLASLSVTHGFLPPHPSPSALLTQFHAEMGTTLLYGIIIAIPTIILAGPIFAQTLKKIPCEPLQTFQPKQLETSQLPGIINSFASALLPVLLLLATTVLPYIIKVEGNTANWIQFASDPVIVMLFSLFFATITLGLMNGMKREKIMDHFGVAIKDISIILLIVAGAGALKQVLVDSGVSATIATSIQNVSINPLILGWMISALIRVCLGSATVAGLTAAGIMAPVLVATKTDPNLMVLAIGAGSVMFSHVNDSGFWLFKEYFNLSLKDTFRSWTLMESIVGVVGLLGVLVIELFLK